MRETAIFSFAIATVATIIARKIFHDWCWHLSMVNLANQKLSQNTFWKRWNLLAKGGMIFTLEGFKCSCYCLSLFTSKSEIKFGRSLLNLIGNKARGSSRRGFHNPGGWYDPCRWCTTFSKQFSPTGCQFELRPISEILFILQFDSSLRLLIFYLDDRFEMPHFNWSLWISVTRFGDLLDFGQVFKVFGNNIFARTSHILRQFL